MKKVYVSQEFEPLTGTPFRRVQVRSPTVSGSVEISVDELSSEITDRIAMLRIAPEEDEVIGVGRNLGGDLYFLYFPDDFDLTRLRP